MKICVQDGGLFTRHNIQNTFQIIREAGFEAIDWNIDVALPGAVICEGDFEDNIFLKSAEEIDAYYAKELSLIREAGLTISQAHAPFAFYKVGMKNEEKIFNLMVKVYESCIYLCDRVGCKNLVIHGASMQRINEDKTPAEIDAINERMYTALIPALQKTNVTVCLENLFASKGGLLSGHCSNPYDAAREIDALNAKAGKECFGLCLDVGHLNLGGSDPLIYFPIVGKRIKALHIHDNDGVTDQHKAPYTGNINWKHFYTALREIGYDGDLSFETFRQTEPTLVDEELIPNWLRLIAEIGQFFREKIQK